MALERGIYDESFIADGAISAYRAVVAGEDNNVHEHSAKHVKLPAAQDAPGLGISLHATTASGDTILVRRNGLAKVEVASANITYGAPLRIHDIRGMVDIQTAAWQSGDGVTGYADGKSSASGDIIECWLAIRTLLG